MKLLISFLYFLCSLFPSAYSGVSAKANKHAFAKLPVQFASNKKNDKIDRKAVDFQFDDSLIGDDDDDDDEPESYRKKAVVSAFAKLSDTFLIDELNDSFRNHSWLYKPYHPSLHDKCIFQRVLRV